MARAKKLYMEVQNGQIRLSWANHAEDSSASEIVYIDRIEASRLGIYHDLLLDAVSEDRATLLSIT